MFFPKDQGVDMGMVASTTVDKIKEIKIKNRMIEWLCKKDGCLDLRPSTLHNSKNHPSGLECLNEDADRTGNNR